MSLSHSRPGLSLLGLLKWLAVGIVCILALAVVGVWGTGRAIPSLLDAALASQASSGLTCETNDSNLFVGRVDLQGLSILNPPGFAEREFAHVRRLVVDVRPLTFLGDGRRVIDEVTLDLDRVTLVGKGDLYRDNNALELAKTLRRSAKADPAPAAAASGEPAARAPGFVIHRLRVRVAGVTVMQEDGGRRNVLVRDDQGISFEAADVTADNLGDTVVAPIGGLALTRAASADPGVIVDIARRQIERSQK